MEDPNNQRRDKELEGRPLIKASNDYSTYKKKKLTRQ